jgi:hypothetical protein
VEQQHLLASPLQVNVLGDGGWTETTRARHTAPRRVELRTTKPAPIGAAIRIDAEDALVLGEVKDSADEGDGFCLSIELMQIIPSVTGLRNLITAIMTPDAGMQGHADRRAHGRHTETVQGTSQPLAS